jgi:hypothetical protein
MARDILAEVKAHRIAAGHTAPLEPEFSDALIQECERQRETIAFQREREAHFAKVLGIPDGGRYRNDWDATLEVVREIATLHAKVRTSDRHIYGRVVGADELRTALDALVRLLPEVH